MFYSGLVTFLLATAASAFVPAGRVSRGSVAMALGPNAVGLVGSDIEYPEFDPCGLSRFASAETMERYRAAELKHGRLAMLAALGQLFQFYVQLPDPVFSEGDKPLAAYLQVAAERPFAIFQIVVFLVVQEFLGISWQNRNPGAAPGELGFDPLNLKYTEDPETWEKVQLRELKNGRLAMIAIAGMIGAEQTNGMGVLEAWKLGEVSPFH
mmetsp:Transcript_37030/g.37689  ORF Transcript_37030/g.37689 Transcript_37030/m.37689 type:complete len:210 (-) Transcript_37030:184-813(-)|eukprot:CAMPEP_0182416262 /NCGR_PEP_ID=MMETSP1167-20130531/520_1 /TAXON_ID=2988 /ORGANISM="Mallomonas Sp, Strain CCMP3275" /LENGTH=209 /DNA_ID=CAMNT_0024588877 /DNA_START=56 /DNA_END=685 /DNA_ORIENTATION=+